MPSIILFILFILSKRAYATDVLGALILAAVMGVYLSRRLTLPLMSLMNTANQIAAGEREAQVAVSEPREIAALAHAFNVMATQFRSTLEDLEQRVEQRTSDLQAALAEVEARSNEQARLLDENAQQQQTIRELSVPVLPLTDKTLVMPLIGAIDTERLANIQERALHELKRASARYLLLDITGVPVADSQVAQGLLSVAQVTRLLGAAVILIGVRPEAAQTIVDWGLDLQSLRTAADLQMVLNNMVK
ncbi:MAG: HAMP domain-containing protein [Chloroflexales bacterium]|nr:HAMP domain-containing protein [Chloroflexales bacterium]